jgi:glutathione S-transferase
VIKLYQFAPAWGLPNLSPFCMKVETYLRMTGLPYEAKTMRDPRKAPKGKLPFIDDDGEIVADSSAILAYLDTKYGDKLGDGSLPPMDRAIAHALRILLDEHFYWAIVYSRWIDDAGWELMKAMITRGMPPVVRNIVPGIIRGNVRKSLHAQGLGRHSPEEIYASGNADLTAVSTYLGDKPFIMGDEPRSLDACVYSYLASALCSPFPSPLKTHAQSLANLQPYCERMKTRYYAA